MVAHSDQVCSYLKGAQGIQGLTLCFLGGFCTVRVPPRLYGRVLGWACRRSEQTEAEGSGFGPFVFCGFGVGGLRMVRRDGFAHSGGRITVLLR